MRERGQSSLKVNPSDGRHAPCGPADGETEEPALYHVFKKVNLSVIRFFPFLSFYGQMKPFKV